LITSASEGKQTKRIVVLYKNQRTWRKRKISHDEEDTPCKKNPILAQMCDNDKNNSVDDVTHRNAKDHRGQRTVVE
jgi:hypothetical protein